MKSGKLTYKNRLLVLFLTITIVVTMMPTMAMTAFAENEKSCWNIEGNYDSTWYTSGDTTEFEIDSAAKLAGLAKLVNDGNSFSGKTIKITKDIDLSAHEWIPIGANGKQFAGSFIGVPEQNGDRVKISNMTITENNSGNDNPYIGFLATLEKITILFKVNGIII